MPTYLYRAVTKDGLIVRNKVESASKQLLIKSLKNNDLMPIQIQQLRYASINNQQKKKKNLENVEELLKNVNTTKLMTENATKKTTKEKVVSYLKTTEKITNRDLVIFTQDFYLLKKANFNNIHALSTIIQSTENPSFKGILEDILAGLEAGENMYTTMEYYSEVFPYIYINMIKVGELSGSLTKSLEQAVAYLDDSSALNRKIRSILIPNILLFVLLMVLLVVGALVGVPTLQSVFDAVGTQDKLPAVTLWFADFVNLVIKYWYIPVLIIIGIVGGIIYYVNTPRGKYNFHKFKYTAPIFGPLIYAIDFSRLMRAMLLNLRNGMRIQESLEISKNVVSNYVMLSIIETAINNMIAGSSWIDPFEESGLSSPMQIEMLRIGMQTDLTEMMDKLVQYMEIDINNILNKIMKVLPQVVYSIVGILLIFFVIVVLVPCVQVYMGNFLFSAYGV